MDPVGAVPLVIAWTAGLAPPARDRQLRDALLTALALGLVFLAVGQALLRLLGVGVPDFLVAGGAVLLVLAVADIAVGGGHDSRGVGSSPTSAPSRSARRSWPARRRWRRCWSCRNGTARR
jgi:small neutral amino acid transporter SnatA (MarC family)